MAYENSCIQPIIKNKVDIYDIMAEQFAVFQKVS